MTRAVLVAADDTSVARATVRLLLERGGKIAHIAPAFGGGLPFDGVTRIAADLTDPQQVAAAVDEARLGLGEITTVVTVAGEPSPGAVSAVGFSGWSSCVERTLTTPYLVAACTMPDLVRTRGSFVAVTSTVAIRGGMRNVAQAAASHGVVGLVKSMALDHARQGVRCNVVCTGVVEADGGSAYAVREVPDLRIPARRPARPAEVAHLVAHLASERASYATGSVVVMDGGLSAGMLKEEA